MATTPALSSTPTKLTPEDRQALNKLVLILEEFRKIDQEMPLQMAITLLTVALEPGSTISDIAKVAGHKLASTSRHVEVLGPWRPAKNKGKGLMVDDYADMDRRRKVINLTPNGFRVIKTLIHLLTHR